MTGALEGEVAARRTQAEAREARRVYWEELLTSLWAPASFFGLAFLAMLVAVELHTPNHLWTQPALKAFGLAMLAYFAGLLVWRALSPRQRKVRKLRHEARELRSEVARRYNRAGAKLDADVRESIIEATRELDRAQSAGDIAGLERGLARLSEAAEKGVSAWKRASAGDFVGGFFKALAIALLIRAVVLEPFKIPSGSMIPTLEIGDQIFVNKFIYGVRIPWANKVPFVIVRPPQRGDVIVFNNPVEPSKDYIKRVVGLPGDLVEVRDEVVYIDGKPQPSRLIDDGYRYFEQDLGPGSGQEGQWYPQEAALFEETLDGRPHLKLQNGNYSLVDVTEGPYRVPEGHVFVLGDNRDKSLDSRYGLGAPTRGVEYVPYGNIKGKAMVIWLSLSHGGFLSDLFGGTGLRTDRLFLPVR